jgi:hypothetical protein
MCKLFEYLKFNRLDECKMYFSLKFLIDIKYNFEYS